ncbi:2OG-Fe(II) oxygenase [Candidatus Woesearchaeota archaeon]|nr:2OG-Fe(II) oxygenase [Candidatus Woesearchaeota archaeon]
MLKGWLNKKYLGERQAGRIRSRFIEAKPYPSFVLQDFFRKGKFLELKKAVSREKFERIGKDLFSLSHTKDLALSKSRVISEFHKLISSNEFVILMETLTGENLSGKIDLQAHAYDQGDYLLFHDDLVEGRSIAYIFYLSTLAAKDGGRLQLYDIKSPKKPVKSISPALNSFACFKVSRKSLHAVEEVMGKRRRLTLGGWFYGR